MKSIGTNPSFYINLFHLVFSSDDRLPATPSRPTSSQPQIEEVHQETEYNYSTHAEPVEAQAMHSTNAIQRPEINFVSRNMERIRLASLKNKYKDLK